MKKIKFGDVLPHLIAVLVFAAVTVIFFRPVFFENKTLAQHDITEHAGIAKSLRDYRNQTGQEGLWAPSLFGGMPAYLVSLEWSDGPIVWIKMIGSLFMPHPVNNIFLAFLCYYIMLLAFRVRPYLAIGGALAFGLSSFIMIGLGAGHNARIGAIAFMPLVVAGIHLTFTGKRLAGFALTSLALALHLRENHLQVTYYLIMVVGAYGLMQLVKAILDKQLAEFGKTMGVLVAAAILAAGTFFGPMWAVTEYSHYSARGPSELVAPVKTSDSEGLSKEYAFRYSNGIWEPMTFLVPNIYGGSSMQSLLEDQQSASYKALMGAGDNQLANQLARYATSYWGNQPLAAPYYAGAIVCFLFVLGALFAERKYVAWLVPLALFSIMLSWGSSFASFNYFLFDHFPGYNKFRSVTFALIILLLAMPLLGAMGLQNLIDKGITKETRRKLLIAFSLTGGVCLLLLFFGGMGDFAKSSESRLPAWFLTAMKSDRLSLMRADAVRSLVFILIAAVPLYLGLNKRIPETVFGLLLALVISIDLIGIDSRYFTKDNFRRNGGLATYEMWDSEKEVLKDKSYYRVFGELGDARPSYYFNSIGGYHGAIIRRFQDLRDSVLTPEMEILAADYQAGRPLYTTRMEGESMLNVKYIVYGPSVKEFAVNKHANGPAWFVRSVEKVNSPNEELNKLRHIDTRTTAVVDVSKFPVSDVAYDSNSRVTVTEVSLPVMKYETESTANGLVVFSEIYYPKGWHAWIDGKEASILRADYVLRALQVPAGKHSIEFKFEPKPYTIGNKVTMASSWILLLVSLGCLGYSLRDREPKSAA